MLVKEAIENRRSIRSFTPREIPREYLNEVLNAGILAPSGKNLQSWRFVVVQGGSKRAMVKVLHDCADREPNKQFKKWVRYSIGVMEEAPVVILVFSPHGRALKARLSEEQRIDEIVRMQSIGAAMENMTLRAADLGLGSLWICDVFIGHRELLSWTNEKGQVAAALALGYANEAPSKRPRKSMDEVVRWMD